MEHFKLTMIGKIAVVKSLVYVLSPLRTNVKAIKKVSKLFYSFLWKKGIKSNEMSLLLIT